PFQGGSVRVGSARTAVVSPAFPSKCLGASYLTPVLRTTLCLLELLVHNTSGRVFGSPVHVIVVTAPGLSVRYLHSWVSRPKCPSAVSRQRQMLYRTLSAAVYGIDANIIEVEVDVSGIKTNEDHFHTVGLPDAAVRESRDRVKAALKNCGYDIPPTHI